MRPKVFIIYSSTAYGIPCGGGALPSRVDRIKRWIIMGFFSNLLGRSDDYVYEPEESRGETLGGFPGLHNGMTLDVETSDGSTLLNGQLTGYSEGDASLTLERLPGGLSFKTREPGTSVLIRGFDEKMAQFILRGTIQESTRLVCRVKDLKVKPIAEHRHDFRLQTSASAALYYPSDDARSNPEDCTLVDISVGGACLQSEYLHAEDEVLRLRVKLADYAPMEFLGEIIRVVEYEPGKFRYGFLFAQLKETELTELTRTLYNIQVGNRQTWVRTESGHW